MTDLNQAINRLADVIINADLQNDIRTIAKSLSYIKRDVVKLNKTLEEVLKKLEDK